MQYTAQVLSAEEQAQVHRESLRILAEVGVKFHGQRALPLLRQHGAEVDAARQVARLPAPLVAEALHAAPASFVLGARNGAFDVPLPGPATRYSLDGTGAFAVDFRTGERRYGVTQDIADALRVFQALDLGVMAWAPTCASDAPAAIRPVHEFFALLRHTSKHAQHEVHVPAQVPYLAAGLQAVLGTAAAVRTRHPCSLTYCPVAPLVHDGDMLDAYLELGALDLPVQIMPMPVPGSTGPASLFSNVCLANAELLSALTVFELAHPGRPLIYSNAIGAVDFRNGAYLAATPEMALQSAALTAMGRYYGLPTSTAGATTDAKQTGPEAVLDKLLTMLPQAAAGTDIIVGYGLLEGDQTLALEQLVVDNEIAHLVARLCAGVEVSAAKDLLADIAQVGPGGHFLKQRSTRQAARTPEFYLANLFDRHTYAAWVELGKPTLYANAREQVAAILAAPPADPLPEAVERELDDILRAAEQKLAEEG